MKQYVESPMHHITLSIDLASLKLARQLGAERDTSVSGLFRELIDEEVQRQSR